MEHWKKNSEEIVYNGWRKMIKKNFELPNGIIADYDIVGNDSFVTVAAVTKDREFILVRQYRPGPEAVIVSFPEGHIDQGESPEETAKRELLEETGYSAENVLLLKVIRTAYSTETRYCLLATGCEKIGEQQLDPNEFIEVFTMPLEGFRSFLQNPDSELFSNIDSGYLALDYLKWL